MTDADPSIRTYAREGSAAAFGEFVGATAPALHRFLTRLLGGADPALIDELAQRAYIAAARKAGTYRGPSATAWLLGMAFLEVRSHRREICRLRSKEVAMPEDAHGEIGEAATAREPGPVELAEAAERSGILRRAMDCLELRERLAVEMVHLEGLAYADAARILEVPAGTVKSRVHRALEALRRRLGPTLAAPCLALLVPSRAEALGPALPADLPLRIEAWARGALAGLEGGAVAGAASILTGLPARLWIAAGVLVLATVPLIIWYSGGAGSGPAAEEPIAAAAKDAPEGKAPPPAPLATAKVGPALAGAGAAADPKASEGTRTYLWARGVVREADGRPLAGVDLRVTEAWDSLDHFPGDPLQVMVWIGGHSGPSRSGPDGRFEVPFLRVSAQKTLIDDYDGIAAKWHFLHLVAKAPDGPRADRAPAHPARGAA